MTQEYDPERPWDITEQRSMSQQLREISTECNSLSFANRHLRSRITELETELEKRRGDFDDGCNYANQKAEERLQRKIRNLGYID